MTQVTGKLQYDPRANKGGYYALKVNDVYYSVGKSDPGVRKGDLVSFEAVQDGEYWKVKGAITKVDQTGGGDTQPAKGSGSSGGGSRPFPVPPRHGDRPIIRQNVLGHAALIVTSNLHEPGLVSDTDLANRTIGVAKILESYAAGDEERLRDEAKLAQATAQQMRGSE